MARTSFRQILEDLSSTAQKTANEMSDRAGMAGYHQHDHIFGDSDTIKIPINHTENGISKFNKSIPGSVRGHLNKTGWEIHNYLDGMASRTRKFTDPNGIPREKKELRRIGSILKDNPEAAKDYEVHKGLLGSANDETHEIIISRSHQHLAEMTSGRKWVAGSCMRLPGPEVTHPELAADVSTDGGVFHHKIEDDMRHGTLIAHMVKKGDDAISNPTARILLKKHIDKNDPSKAIWRPEKVMKYGSPSKAFYNTVRQWSVHNYPTPVSDDGKEFVKHPELYDDDDAGPVYSRNSKGESLVTKPNGWDKVAERRRTNDNEELHTDTDEPSFVKTALDFSHSTKMWHKNDVLHRTNGPALERTVRHNDLGKLTTHEEWYQHGVAHRDDDKPATIRRDENTGIERDIAYAKFGYMHRDPKKGPATISRIVNKDHGILEETHEYMSHGILHRDPNDGPAFLRTSHDGSIGFASYYHHGKRVNGPNGLPHSTSDNLSSWVNENGGAHISVQEYSRGDIEVNDYDTGLTHKFGRDGSKITHNPDTWVERPMHPEEEAKFKPYVELHRKLNKRD